MIKERSDFFQNAKFFPILNIYNSPDDLCIQICMNSKFDAIPQPVVVTDRRDSITCGTLQEFNLLLNLISTSSLNNFGSDLEGK